MSFSSVLTTSEIDALFTEEIRTVGGQVLDQFHDGGRLFLRAVCSRAESIQPGDRVQGGVALRAVEDEVCVRPYVFRLVCRNGAIRAHALQAQQFTLADFPITEEAEGAIRDAVRACCDQAVLWEGAAEMRNARESEADLALTLLGQLQHFPAMMKPRVLEMIMNQFTAAGDRSRFGMMNAVTATAGDIPEPELRWQLEELGGGVPVARTPNLPRDAAMAAQHQDSRRGVLIAS